MGNSNGMMFFIKDIIKKGYACLIYSICILLFILTPFNIQSSNYFITTGQLNLRIDANSKSESIVLLHKGDTVKLIEDFNNDWFIVKYKIDTGFISKHYLSKIQYEEIIDIPKDEIKKPYQEEPDYSSLVFIALILIVIIIFAGISFYSGKTIKTHDNAALLSLFFGSFGFQHFYLGNTKRGLFSILFCWTTIPTIVGFANFASINKMSIAEFNNLFNDHSQDINNCHNNQLANSENPKNKTKFTISSIFKLNPSIVNEPTDNKASSNNLTKPKPDESFWMPPPLIGSYFNEYSFFSRAHTEQKKFYSYFKSQFNRGVCFSLKGENNYAFLLYYILLAEYEIHKDYSLLKSQFQLLIKICPELKSNVTKDLSNLKTQAINDDYSLTNSNEDSFTIKNQTADEVKVLDNVIQSLDNRIAKLTESNTNETNEKSSIVKNIIENKQLPVPKTSINVESSKITNPNLETNQINIEPSIIEVNSQEYNLTIDNSVPTNDFENHPPHWDLRYIYSTQELRYANKEQKDYYNYFKKQVLDGFSVDIKGETNYAFILLFDLFYDLGNNLNIDTLEEKLLLLGQICPKTKSYSTTILKDRLRKRSDILSKEKLFKLDDPNYLFEVGFSDFDPNQFRLGTKYKDKLKLSKQEILWLNKIHDQSNVFTAIEGCCLATIKLYIFTLYELNDKLNKQGNDLDKTVSFFINQITEYYKNEYNNSDYNYSNSNETNWMDSVFYSAIYKRVENKIRRLYKHNRRLSETFSCCNGSLDVEFDTKIGKTVEAILDELIHKIDEPDFNTQVVLNSQNTNRWKTEFNQYLISLNNGEVEKFKESMVILEIANKNNPNIENILYEASKHIAKFDKIASLTYYAKYVHYDLNSSKFNNLKLNLTAQKFLFKTEEQQSDFTNIIVELIQTKDINKAIASITTIYKTKRKQIDINKSAIKSIEVMHNETLQILNQYLDTDNEVIFQNNDNSLAIVNPDMELYSINHKSSQLSPIKSAIVLNDIQIDLVKMFLNNSFLLKQSEVELYAKNNGIFKNQLIDSINENCSEYLDGEALIEEDNDNYIIEESYYKEIAK